MTSSSSERVAATTAVIQQLFEREWLASEKRFSVIRLSLLGMGIAILTPLRTYVYGTSGEGGDVILDLIVIVVALLAAGAVAWRLRRPSPPRALGYAGIVVDYLTLAALLVTQVRTDYVAELGLTIETYKLLLPLALTINVLSGARLSRRQVLLSGACCAAVVIEARLLDVFVHGAPVYVFTNVLLLSLVGATTAGAHFMVSKARALIGEVASKTFEAHHVRDVLSRYISEPVVEMVLRDEGQMRAGRRERITVMFTDIRGFTELSERLPPEEVVTLLNAYFSRMVDALFRYDGMLDKYIGDGMMALFGAIVPQPDHAARAVRAASAMRDELIAFNRELEARGMQPVKIGIGLHTGECVVGNIGTQRRLEFTAIGDVVNTSSRVEGLTKSLGADILMTAECFEQVKDLVVTRKIPAVEIRGRKSTMDLYALQGLRIDAPPTDRRPAAERQVHRAPKP